MRKKSNFATKNDSSLYVGKLLNEANDKREKVLRTTFDPLEITECDRRLIYRIMGEQEKKTNLELICKDFLKKKWVEYFKKINIKVIEKNLVCSDCNYNLVGNVDIVIQLKGLITIVKVHIVDNQKFLTVMEDGPFKKHIIDLMTNIWLSETDAGLLIYENRIDNRFSIFDVNQYDPIIRSVQKKCLNLLTHKTLGKFPVRSYKNATSFECEKCEFKEQCRSC